MLAKFIHNINWKEVNNSVLRFFHSFKFLACFKIWTSDLKRSWQTANLLVKAENSDDLDNVMLMKPLPVIQTDVRIRERVRLLYCLSE